MMRSHRGFTLVELMIVVTIISILAAIAIPAYQDYSVRAKVAEIVLATGAYKTTISEKGASDGTLASSGVGLTVSTGGRVAGGSVTDAGLIILVGSAATLGTAVTVILTPSLTARGGLAWGCSTGSSDQWKYVPSECRH